MYYHVSVLHSFYDWTIIHCMNNTTFYLSFCSPILNFQEFFHVLWILFLFMRWCIYIMNILPLLSSPILIIVFLNVFSLHCVSWAPFSLLFWSLAFTSRAFLKCLVIPDCSYLRVRHKIAYQKFSICVMGSSAGGPYHKMTGSAWLFLLGSLGLPGPPHCTTSGSIPHTRLWKDGSLESECSDPAQKVLCPCTVLGLVGGSACHIWLLGDLLLSEWLCVLALSYASYPQVKISPVHPSENKSIVCWIVEEQKPPSCVGQRGRYGGLAPSYADLGMNPLVFSPTLTLDSEMSGSDPQPFDNSWQIQFTFCWFLRV